MPIEPPAIDLKGVGVRRGTRWILRDVTWTVPASACCAILGPNGSGKSTLTRILAGHLFPSAGECSIIGEKFGEGGGDFGGTELGVVPPVFDDEQSSVAETAHDFTGLGDRRDAIQRAGSTDPEKIREALSKTDYEGPNGKFSFDAKGQAHGFNIVLVQLTNNVPKVVAATSIGE